MTSRGHVGRRALATAVAAAALLVATPAPAPLCVDASGHKVYQQSPCPELVIRSGIEPVKAEALDQKNVLETIRRFDAAVGKRDLRAVASFLDDDFQMVLYEAQQGTPPRRVGGYTRTTFIGAVGKTATVMSGYKASRSNCKVEVKEQSALATCDTKESVVVTSHTGDFASTDRIRVVLREGVLLIRAIDQESRKSEITTQSLKAGEQPRKRK